VNLFICMMIFLPFVGGFLSYLIGRRNKAVRDVFACGITIVEFLCSLVLVCGIDLSEPTMFVIPEVCGMGLQFTTDGFRVVYAAIAAFMWMMTTLLSKEYFAHYRNRNRYYLFCLITLGATEAIFLSADLYTTFIFFEIMSLASYVWVAQDEREASLRAASTYLAVAVIGGLVMLMGLFLLYHQTGTLQIDLLQEACQGKNVYVAALCLLTGFGAKAGAFPLHIWLPKAHPVAPAPASALLSGILTKTGIFGILVIACKVLMYDEMWGVLMLLLGTVTMFLGALLAVFSIDFKRTLACSSVSQIGFILVGVGMQGLLAEHNALAIRGTLLHMVNHSAFKLVLFMVAGVIYMNTHKLDLNEIRGFGYKKPLLFVIYLMGALGIGGIPIFSGYVSKTLLHESIVEYIHGMEHGEFVSAFFRVGDMKLIEAVFLISGGLTIAYMCKLFVAVFLEKNNDVKLQKTYEERKKYMSPCSIVALVGSAVLIPIMGIMPYATMNRIADIGQGFMGHVHMEHEVHYFTWTNLKGSVISILIGAVVYLVVVRGFMMEKQANGKTRYVNRWPEKLDLEEVLYRPVLLKVLPAICGGICSIFDRITDVLVRILIGVGSFFAGFLDVITDGFVVFLRKTIYRDSPRVAELEEGNEMTHALGSFLNAVEAIFNRFIWKEHPHKMDFEHWFALKYASFKENASFIGRSLSYGLILFCLGLCATLIYMLIYTMI